MSAPAVPVHLTVDDILQHMADAVAARGEGYVYEPPAEPPAEPGYVCIYVSGDCPSCLIGVVLHACGVPLEALSLHNDAPADALIDYLRRDGIVTAEDGVPTVLLAAQHIQDGYQGRPGTWGAALAAAREVAVDIGVAS